MFLVETYHVTRLSKLELRKYAFKVVYSLPSVRIKTAHYKIIWDDNDLGKMDQSQLNEIRMNDSVYRENLAHKYGCDT